MKLLSSDQVAQFAREKSVRGAVVRKVQQRADDASQEQLQVLEEALSLLLDCFQAEPGES